MNRDMRLSDDTDDSVEYDPLVQLWLMYYISNSKLQECKYEEALKYVNLAIEHTPTLIELYTLKSSIYKNVGNIKKCADLQQEAFKLDQADRFLSARCARFQIRNNQLAEAEASMMPFSTDQPSGELNVHDMQSMWYEVEHGNLHLQEKNYRLAYKNFYYLEKHFEQMQEDQFDFHVYAMRKFTLGSYFQMMELQDTLYKNKYAVKSVLQMIKIFSKV